MVDLEPQAVGGSAPPAPLQRVQVGPAQVVQHLVHLPARDSPRVGRPVPPGEPRLERVRPHAEPVSQHCGPLFTGGGGPVTSDPIPASVWYQLAKASSLARVAISYRLTGYYHHIWLILSVSHRVMVNFLHPVVIVTSIATQADSYSNYIVIY